MIKLPSIERVSELLDYDIETGVFTRTNKPMRGIVAGEVAGTADHYGYRIITIDKVSYKAHRLSWLMATGSDPGDKFIDHINGNPSDNRISNLRLVEQSCNLKNAAMKSNNKSGIAGVWWDSRRGGWQSYVNSKGKRTVLGRFENIFDAAAARISAANKLGFTERHGRIN